MTKTTTTRIVIAIAICLTANLRASAQFSGGTGTSEDPYIITTDVELAQLATLVNAGNTDYNAAHYKLANNIDLSAYGEGFNDGKGWIPIGTYLYPDDNPFRGTFDGNEKIITGLFINNQGIGYVGLFGHVLALTENAFRNIGLEGVNIRGHQRVGGLVGNIRSYDRMIGISNCYTTGTVFGQSERVGGIVGSTELTAISNCYSLADVSGASAYVGGIVGLHYNTHITNCYAAGSVTAVNWGGGLVGLYQFSVSIMQNCAALNPEVKTTGSVIGRLAGSTESALINNIGFEEMLNRNGTTEWLNKGLDQMDGEDIDRPTINADGTLGGRFLAVDGWTIVNGKLPGLFGNAVDMPEHLQPEPELPPSIITTSLPAGEIDIEYSAILSATGTTPITWSINSGALPDGLTLNAETGEISGIPTIVNIFSFSVKASNRNGEDTGDFQIEIIPEALPPSITTVSLPDGISGTAYFQTLTATGSTPITWSIESGALPTGLSINSNTGVISGIPNVANDFYFTVMATNSVGSDTKDFQITIDLPDTPPVITTTSLPNGEIDKPYTATLEATGAHPIEWTLTSGSLPTGLTLQADGTISGIPTELDWFNFTVQATNSIGSNSKTLSIFINSVGIEQLRIKNYELRIYPNPTTGVIYVAMGQAPLSNNIVEIYDMTGRSVGANLCVHPDGTINISHLPNGLYILKIDNQTFKIVKQ